MGRNRIETSEHARALSEVGAAKGGKARAAKLYAEDRSEIARRAAEARWGTDVPRATHTGQLKIADRTIDCAVLENGTRLLTQRSFMLAIGRAARAKGGTGSERLLNGSGTQLGEGLPPFLAAENLRPFISDELRQSTVPIMFRTEKGVRAYGYEAKLLDMVCEVYLRARDEGVFLKSQEGIVKTCDLLMRGLARVGIIALVDEATGYQEMRARDELAKILEAYISEELRPWVQKFPDEFFRQVYRIHKWPYKPGRAKHTPLMGKLINKYVYEQLPPGVLPELRRRNPIVGTYRKHKHHQFLTADTGDIHLDKQITAVTTIMRVSESKEQFEELFERAYGNTYQQMRMPLVVKVDD